MGLPMEGFKWQTILNEHHRLYPLAPTPGHLLAKPHFSPLCLQYCTSATRRTDQAFFDAFLSLNFFFSFFSARSFFFSFLAAFS